MNKAELVDCMSEFSDMSKTDCSKALDAFFESVALSLRKGEEVTLVGFGTFSVKEREARKGRNPQTGGELEIPAAKVPKFKPGKKLVDAASGNI